MFAFAASATVTKPREGFTVGQSAPFIVYINYKDLPGAEMLCKMYVMREGFKDVTIEKRQPIADARLLDPQVVSADKALREALEYGYALQLFDSE